MLEIRSGLKLYWLLLIFKSLKNLASEKLEINELLSLSNVEEEFRFCLTPGKSLYILLIFLTILSDSNRFFFINSFSISIVSGVLFAIILLFFFLILVVFLCCAFEYQNRYSGVLKFAVAEICFSAVLVGTTVCA